MPVISGVVTSALAATCLLLCAPDRRVAALVLALLCFSRSFIDFSTSGLENPLRHLLSFAFYSSLLRRRGGVTWLAFLAALCVVNRVDLATLVLPPLVWRVWRSRGEPRRWRKLALGAVPVLLWFAFALVYFGYPLPNTSLAKLNAEIPRSELTRQGVSYLLDTTVNDPAAAISIATAVVVLVRQARVERAAIVLLFAFACELFYLIWIGGDFMSGRFVTLLACAGVVLAHYGATLFTAPAALRNATAAVFGLILSTSFSPFRDERTLEKPEFPSTRIVNERAWYHEHTLLPVNVRPVAWREGSLYKHGEATRGRGERVTVSGSIGMYSWGAGPSVHVVDDLALSDPLVARIPYTYDREWRPGHLRRKVPEGYLRTLETGHNTIADPCLARYYDELQTLVRGPLWTARARSRRSICLRDGRYANARWPSPCPE